MPELPEVETIRRQLAQDLTGYSFEAVETNWEKSFRPSFTRVRQAVIGKKILRVGRQAKLLIFSLSSASYLFFHLKLTGRMLVRKMGASDDEFTRSVFTLVKGRSKRELRFADARKFGFVQSVSDPEEMKKLLQGYGPEPLKDLTLEKFRRILAGSSRPIKLILLDQEKISGIGNIYANDALWLAGIDPRRAGNKVTEMEGKRLFKAVTEVLKKGLKYGGASDQWYRQVHGESGQYQEHFLVYGQTGKRCSRCGTVIQRIVLGGRGTFLCPVCQSSQAAQSPEAVKNRYP